MKKAVLLIPFLLLFFVLNAQSGPDDEDGFSLFELSPELVEVLNQFSVTVSIGSQSFGPDDLKNLQLNDFKNISLGEVTISYKINEKISIGLSTLGSLGNCLSGYFDAEGGFVPFETEDDEMEEDDGDEPEDDDDECEDDFGQNLMGSMSYKISNKLPFFVQASAGYSFNDRAPAYSAMIGYNQNIFAGIGLKGGIRFSEVLYKKPIEASRLAPSHGWKAELGLSWNF